MLLASISHLRKEIYWLKQHSNQQLLNKNTLSTSILPDYLNSKIQLQILGMKLYSVKKYFK